MTHASKLVCTCVIAAAAIVAACVLADGNATPACMDAGFSPSYCAQYIATVQAPANPDHADN